MLAVNIYKESNQKKDEIERLYHYKAVFSLYKIDEKTMQDIADLEIKNCRISIGNLPIFIDESEISSFAVSMELYNDTDRKIHLTSGAFPTKEEINEEGKMALVGIKNKGIVHDGYITIQGENYKVAGYISGKYSSLYSFDILLFDKNISNNFLKCVDIASQMGMPYLIIESDEMTIDEIVNVVSGSLDNEKVYNVMSYDDIPVGSTVESSTIQNVRKITIVFCILMIFIMCSIWINSKMYEYAVRKAYGESIIRLLKSTFYDLFRYILISTVIGVSIAILTLKIENVIITKEIYSLSISVAAIVIVALSLITIVVPFFKLIRIDAVTLIKESRGKR
ncbi:MAG: hypothetical protein IIY49_07550 [Eubacterium sp.]|nr:hypothetical protein [Eubacterium sp.]